MKYNISENGVIWNKSTGISATICARQKAAGWNKAKLLCFARTGRPEKDSVTSDIAMRLFNNRARNNAPDLTKRPAEVAGAL